MFLHAVHIFCVGPSGYGPGPVILHCVLLKVLLCGCQLVQVVSDTVAWYCKGLLLGGYF